MRLPFNPWVLWCAERIKHNKNVIGVFLGPTGSGKTYACLDFALNISKELGTNFSVQDNVAFSFTDLLKKTQLPQNNKPGTVFVFEEVGAFGSGAASSQWASRGNAVFNSFLQIIRSKNHILLFTTPNFKLLANQDRALCHFTAEMKSINPQNKESLAYLKLYSVNQFYGKEYRKWLRVNHNGSRLKVVNTYFKLPPESILKPYEAEKNIFIDKFCRKVLEESEPKEKSVKITKEQLEQELKAGASLNRIIIKYGFSNYRSLYYYFAKYNIKIPEREVKSDTALVSI